MLGCGVKVCFEREFIVFSTCTYVKIIRSLVRGIPAFIQRETLYLNYNMHNGDSDRC